MESILERIVTTTRRRLFSMPRYPEYKIIRFLTEKRDNRFLAMLTKGEGVNIIAEIKCASPSRGKLLAVERIPEMVFAYENGGAKAISVVTEETHFGGSVALLRQLAHTSSLPVLRKDFVLEETQIYESVENGAEALLLIARIVSTERLKYFIELCTLCGLVPVVEVHDERDVEKALEAGAQCIGINNRNLATFEVSLTTTFRLLPLIPPTVVVISESGIKYREEIETLLDRGVRTFLIGETLLTASTPQRKLEELLGSLSSACCEGVRD